MKLCIISFTKNGYRLSEKIASVWAENEVCLFTKCSALQGTAADAAQGESGEAGKTTEECRVAFGNALWVNTSVGEWAKERMQEKNILLFIGACGIAVRAIAPWVADKLQDSPVLVMDEQGRYVIPLLSGHVGSANEIAQRMAQRTGATAVITTATDLNRCFAVDLFAKKNGLSIVNREGIARVSAKVLSGKPITLSIDPKHLDPNVLPPREVVIAPWPPKGFVDVAVSDREEGFDASLLLRPREYVIGMGCRRGKEAEQIEALIARSLRGLDIREDQVFALASIDKKKDEEGFLKWSERAQVPFFTYTAEQLQEVEGEFTASGFVKQQVGVDNVCERAALKACARGGLLVSGKHAEDGMTIAVAKREWRAVFDEQ